MARDWRDLFIVDGAPAPEAQSAPEAEQRRGGMFRRLRENLRKTRQALTSEIQATLFEELNDETWERLEEALIYADVGARTTAEVVEQLEHEATSGEVSGGEALTARLTELLADIARTGDDRIDLHPKPTVILVAGRQRDRQDDDGRQARLAPAATSSGSTVVLGAADTFRAAGVEQLEVWAQRAGVQFVKGPPNADPGAVAYDAIAAGRRDGADVVIIDTAGRLHTQDDLMAELAKVRRVISKQIPDAPHETLLTVDATTGPERAAPGQDVLGGDRRLRARADQARRHRQGRDRAGDRARAGHPGQAHRGRRAARGPAPVRPDRFRPRAGHLSGP